ncbi:MAG TPA: toll/interleukin-1 receptor domain-containing protein [Chthoniobacteraceae bacterium]|jgi:hypothetical protein|nr:toll/interleukin-1 receptor domain-containing protein [Chthoniobacteraceae bacterium]
MNRTKAFVSYSQEDESWKRQLITHLAVLEFEGLLHVWSDTRINAGDDWFQRLGSAMDDSRVAVLLISPSFLASNFIRTEEVPRLLCRHADDGMLILPLIARPCAWQLVPWLSCIQMRPKNGTPLSSGSPDQIDIDLSNFTYEIAALLRRFEPPPSAAVDSACAAFDAACDAIGNTRRPIDDKTLISLLGLAIEHGAPAYNAGSPMDCASIYRHAADRLLRLISEAKSLRRLGVTALGIQEAEILLRPVAASTEINHPAKADELAWKLRKAFDRILEVSRSGLTRRCS